jgi:hypothetical protein
VNVIARHMPFYDLTSLLTSQLMKRLLKELAYLPIQTLFPTFRYASY